MKTAEKSDTEHLSPGETRPGCPLSRGWLAGTTDSEFSFWESRGGSWSQGPGFYMGTDQIRLSVSDEKPQHYFAHPCINPVVLSTPHPSWGTCWGWGVVGAFP